jgi:hypothetical protein
MPKDFEDCVKNGGRVVTKSLKGGKYMHVCYDKNGNSYSGEVKNKKKSSENSNNKVISDSKDLIESLKELQKHFNTNYHV